MALARIEEISVTMEFVACCECGLPFGMPQTFLKKLRENGNLFHCPNGHGQAFKESEVQRLKKELERAKRAADNASRSFKAEQEDHDYTRNRLRATKGVLTKTKKRIAEGMCPVCDKSFKVLEKHMASQHPGYEAEPVEE